MSTNHQKYFESSIHKYMRFIFNVWLSHVDNNFSQSCDNIENEWKAKEMFLQKKLCKLRLKGHILYYAIECLRLLTFK